MPLADGTAQREAWRRWAMGALQGFAALLAQEIAAKLAPMRFDFSGLWAHNLAGRGAAFAKDGARRYGARACGRPKRADSDGAGGDGPRPPEGDEAALTRREGLTHGPLGNPDQGSQESPPLPPAPDCSPPDANAWCRARALFNRGKGSAGSALATL